MVTAILDDWAKDLGWMKGWEKDCMAQIKKSVNIVVIVKAISGSESNSEDKGKSEAVCNVKREDLRISFPGTPSTSALVFMLFNLLFKEMGRCMR